MKNRLFTIVKHIFIPHKGNEFKPHFFREMSVIAIMFVSTFLLGASAGSSFFIHKTVLGASISSSVLIDYTNESRLAYNEPILVRNEKLDRAAQLKGEDMARAGYFSHESPEGVTPWHWFKSVGYIFSYAGENLAVDFTESKDVQQAWLDSPTHKANLLNVKFKEIGIATVEGLYENNPTIFVVQMFGTPAKAESKIIPSAIIIKKEDSTLVSTTTEKVNNEIVKVSNTKSPSQALTSTNGTSSLLVGTTSELRSIISDDKLAVVENTNTIELSSGIDGSHVKYSTWYERLVFGGSKYIDFIYKILIGFVAVALLVMITVEIKKQHTKHIVYGIFLLAILILFIFINRTFF